MKQLLIFTFIFFSITLNAQDEERFNFLSEQICECIENLRKVNEETHFRCQKKIFRKNKKKIKKLIEQEELKTYLDRLSNHFRPLTLNIKAVEKVIDSCPKFRTYYYNEFLKPKREEIYKKIVNEYCPILNAKLKEQPDLDIVSAMGLFQEMIGKYNREVFKLIDLRDNKEESIDTYSVEIQNYIETNCETFSKIRN